MHRSALILMDFNGFQWISICFRGFRRVLRFGGLTSEAGRCRRMPPDAAGLHRMAADGIGVVAPKDGTRGIGSGSTLDLEAGRLRGWDAWRLEGLDAWAGLKRLLNVWFWLEWMIGRRPTRSTLGEVGVSDDLFCS